MPSLDRKKKEMSKRLSNKRAEKSDSDDDDDFSINSSEEEMDELEYRKFLKKIFPSKYLDKKIKAGEKIKKRLEYSSDEDEDEEDDDEEEDEEMKKNTKNTKNKNKNKKNHAAMPLRQHQKALSRSKSQTALKNKKRLKKEVVDSDDDEEGDEDEDEEDEKPIVSVKKSVKKNKNVRRTKAVEKEDYADEDEDDDEDEEDDDDEDAIPNGKASTKPSKFNIIFTIGNAAHDEEDEDDDEWEDMDDDDDDSDDSTEDEDESVSDSGESSDDDDTEDDEDDEDDNTNVKKSKAKKESVVEKEEVVVSKKKNSKKPPLSPPNIQPESEFVTPEKQTTNEEFVTQLKELYEKNKQNSIAQKCLKIAEISVKESKKKQERKTEKTKERNSRIFRKIVRDKNTMNDFEFFSKLEIEHQKKIIKELREINKQTRVEKPYRLTLLDADMPTLFKGAAMKKLNSLRYMEPGSGEYYKIKNWVDTFMRVPFGKYKTLPVTMDDGVDACHTFMESAKNTLDDAVYGLNDAKMQIMQLLGQLITNPVSIGTAIAIHGPPGTGKTSLVKEGISKILNRPFAFIALGGATDSSFLEGHSYTYEGSTWGKIVQILIDSNCMNPVIYFDELDKISDTPKGEEIAGILTHLTDTSQNGQYHDKYFAEVDFDLSKCLFIFSYNDESKVNPILRDRMYRIKTKGYDKKQKTVISNQYLLPKIREQVKFDDDQIIIPDDTLQYIMENYCSNEDGVRNMKRCLEIIYTKLNLYRLMRPGTNLFEQEMSLVVEFPFTVTKEVVQKLITKEREDNMGLRGMYV